MKILLFVLTLILTFHHTVLAQCNSGSYTVKTNALIKGSCTITGDLTILNGATLNVDLTGSTNDTFLVRGNILLKGNAVLWVHATFGSTGDLFIVSNNFNSQRTITTKDSSKIILENIEFRTQEGNLANAASITMSYNAMGNSILLVKNSKLDPQKAWLLFNLKNKSTLMGYNANHLPTEIYLQDTAQVALHGANTNTGIWLTFESITSTLNLPPDQSKPFTWKVGRGANGLNTQWYFEADTVQVGLSVQILPTAKMVINGAGNPATKELTVALLFANGTDTLKNLKVGVQNTRVANGTNGSVTLNNVNLGPIAWQLYALMNEHLYIKNSVVNEIGIAGPSSVVVDSSLLQLAVLASIGIGGSTMTINKSDIWNQAIVASNHSKITINNSNVTGSWLSTTDTGSHITVNGGCFFQNSSGCTMNIALNWSTGQPYCNPFIPSGYPQILTPATIVLNGVNYNCGNGIETLNDNKVHLTIYPNPFSTDAIIRTDEILKNATLTVFNSLGQPLKQLKNITGQTITLHRDNIPCGLYLLHLTQNNKLISTGKLIITD